MLSRPIGFINGAIQEYHYLANRGTPLGPWGNAICYLDAWAAGSEAGRPYLDQILPTKGGRMMAKLFAPLFVTGEPEWGDYTVEVTMTPRTTDDLAGLVFRYHTNRHHYIFTLQDGNKARLAIRMPIEEEFRICRFKELATADFPYKTDQAYRLKVENRGPEIRAYVDDRLIVSASSDDMLTGKTGITANVPCRFQDFRVTATPRLEQRSIDGSIRGSRNSPSCSRRIRSQSSGRRSRHPLRRRPQHAIRRSRWRWHPRHPDCTEHSADAG